MGDEAAEPEHPDPSKLQHGDILLPRRFDATAISSFTDAVAELGEDLFARSSERDLPPWRPPSDGESVDLIAYWPYLMGYLREVRDGDKTIIDLFLALHRDLKGTLDMEDLSQAIIAKQYVGHCAILDWPDPHEPAWIIESSHSHGGLHTMPYAAWLKERRAVRASVWAYRLNPLQPEGARDLRTRFVHAAHTLRMQGVRYAIFDGRVDGSKMCLEVDEQRRLGEPPYLYCSELVWLCAKEICGCDLLERPPGTDDARRFGMFTPKDITGSRHVSPVFRAHRVPYFRPFEPLVRDL